MFDRLSEDYARGKPLDELSDGTIDIRENSVNQSLPSDVKEVFDRFGYPDERPDLLKKPVVGGLSLEDSPTGSFGSEAEAASDSTYPDFVQSATLLLFEPDEEDPGEDAIADLFRLRDGKIVEQ